MISLLFETRACRSERVYLMNHIFNRPAHAERQITAARTEAPVDPSSRLAASEDPFSATTKEDRGFGRTALVPVRGGFRGNNSTVDAPKAAVLDMVFVLSKEGPARNRVFPSLPRDVTRITYLYTAVK